MQTKFERRRQRDRIVIGDSYLTSREYQVVSMYIDGVRPMDMPRHLAMAAKTRDGHMRVARERIGAKTLHQLVAMVAAADALRTVRPSASDSNRDILHAARTP